MSDRKKGEPIWTADRSPDSVIDSLRADLARITAELVGMTSTALRGKLEAARVTAERDEARALLQEWQDDGLLSDSLYAAGWAQRVRAYLAPVKDDNVEPPRVVVNVEEPETYADRLRAAGPDFVLATPAGRVVLEANQTGWLAVGIDGAERQGILVERGQRITLEIREQHKQSNESEEA